MGLSHPSVCGGRTHRYELMHDGRDLVSDLRSELSGDFKQLMLQLALRCPESSNIDDDVMMLNKSISVSTPHHQTGHLDATIAPGAVQPLRHKRVLCSLWRGLVGFRHRVLKAFLPQCQCRHSDAKGRAHGWAGGRRRAGAQMRRR